MNPDVLESLLDTQLPAAAAGDRAAYGRIVAGCQGTVTSIALAITRDLPASEDIAQEAFLSAWQHLGRLNNPASFLPWLRQITRNLARDHLRTQARRGSAPLPDADRVLAAVADPRPAPEDALAEAEEHAIAARVIDELPEEAREVLLLYYREGQNSRQVAALLGLQDAAVRKRLSRARQQVRAELLERLAGFARRSAPGAAFTSVVLAALATGSGPAAAATAFGVGALGGAQGAAKLGGVAFGAAMAGIVGGLSGIWGGIGRLLRAPHDERERRGLLAYGAVTSALVVVFAFGINALASVPGWIPHLALSLGFMVGIVACCSLWLPRILARRHALEAQRDPVGAAARRARERRSGRLGMTLGLGLGTLGLVLGLWASGRLG